MMSPNEDHNFIIKYLHNNTEAVDKMLALSWIVQAWKVFAALADEFHLDRDYVFDEVEKMCPVGVIKILLEIDTDVSMRERDGWIYQALDSDKSTNDILKVLIAGSREPRNFDFGD